MDNIKRELKALRVKRGYTQEELAKKLGKTKQTYLTYEHDPNKIRYDVFLKLIDILGEEIVHIFFKH